VLPHLSMNFYVYDDTATAPDYAWGAQPGKRYTIGPLGTPMRAFGLDLGATVGVDLNLLNQPLHNFDFQTSAVSWPREGLPTWYAQNDGGFDADEISFRFPIYTYPGGIEMRTGRVIDVTAIIDPEVRFYLEYYEAISDWDPADPDYPDFYEDVLGNLLPVILSGLIQVDLTMGIDLGRIMDTPFAVNGTVGPLGAGDEGIFAAGPNRDTAGTVPAWPPLNLGLTSPDWLGIFISLQGQLSAKALLALGAPMISGFTGGDGTDDLLGGFGFGGFGGGETLEIMNINVDDLMGALGAAMGGIGGLLGLGERPNCADFSDTPPTNIDDPPYSWSPCSPFSPSYWAVWDNYYPPETTIHEPEVVDARGTLVTFDAYDEKDSDGQIRFSYRLDGGLWSPWKAERYALLKGLLEGRHLLQVRALDSDNNIEATPAAMIFTVDSIPPTIALSGTVRGSTATFVAEVRDFQSQPENVQIAYRLDGAVWSDYQTAKTIELAHLSDGTHTLSVKAIDQAGNEAIATQAFNVAPEAAFGCATVPGSGGAALLLLLVPGLFLLRRKLGR
jgi:hypothetical protein